MTEVIQFIGHSVLVVAVGSFTIGAVVAGAMALFEQLTGPR